MDYSTGKLSFIFIVAMGLSYAAAWGVAWRYRAAVARLMRAPAAAAARPAPAMAPATLGGAASAMPAGAAAVTPRDAETSVEPQEVATLAGNRRAAWRLSALLLGLSLLMAASAGWLQLSRVPGVDVTPHRLALMTLMHLWPAIPAIGMAWRWPGRKVFGVLAAWLVVCFAVVMWRSTEAQSVTGVLSWIAFGVGLPALLVSALCLGQRTRAIAPWLLPPFVGLVWASILGTDLLWWFVTRQSPWLVVVSGWLGAYTVMALFALLPWLLAAWPLRWLARALAAAYVKKQLSELMVLFTALWGIELLIAALTAASDSAWAGVQMLLPLLWIPAVMALLRLAPRRPAARAPTLLVLRVFQRDAATRRLFDDVIERWRLSGNTLLIAGTDLIDRTLDADELFSFLDGRLHMRFIRSDADLAARIASFDLARDADGRFRINECFCQDSSWKAALAALVQRSDVALMDLRGFKPHNEGCRHELGALASSQRLRRVVVLTDGDTDLADAQAAAAGAPAQRFLWLDAAEIARGRRDAVLAALFVDGPPPAHHPAAMPTRNVS